MILHILCIMINLYNIYCTLRENFETNVMPKCFYNRIPLLIVSLSLFLSLHFTQLVCQRFFIARHQLFLFPLLHDPPLSIQRNLKTLLHECIHPLEPSTRISKRLAKNLKKLLLSTLKKDWTVL